ncbi:SDR family NAD(P)-dependent oxidoreductase, partial [Nocardioides sp. NPDC000441]
MNAQLQDRTAIVWGGAGDIGSTTAKAFAEAGATVYLAGRTEASLAARAEEVGAAGYGVVDILDEDAVVAFVERVVAETGSLDISFNVADRGDIQGQTLLEISAADFTQPVVRGIAGSFHTARA